MNKTRKILFALMIPGFLMAGGCASLGVEPWERDTLARPEMSLSHEAITIGLDEHIYFSKEASSGGRGFAGGGCGCN